MKIYHLSYISPSRWLDWCQWCWWRLPTAHTERWAPDPSRCSGSPSPLTCRLKFEHRIECGYTSVHTGPTVDGVSMQSVSVLNTMGYTGAVCWRVLQHWSVVKLVVLHCVVGEQAPAHTQGRLGGWVGYLRVDYWSRRSCRRHIFISPVLLSSQKISTATGLKKEAKHYRQHADISLCRMHCTVTDEQFVHQTWNNVDGVHHGFDIWQVGQWHVKLQMCGQHEVDILFGKLLDSSVEQTKNKTASCEYQNLPQRQSNRCQQAPVWDVCMSTSRLFFNHHADWLISVLVTGMSHCCRSKHTTVYRVVKRGSTWNNCCNAAVS